MCNKVVVLNIGLLPSRVERQQRLIKTEQIAAYGLGCQCVGVGEISTPPRAAGEGLVESEINRVVPGANVVVGHQNGRVTQVADFTPPAAGLVGIEVAPGKGEPVVALNVGEAQRSGEGSERLTDADGPLISVLRLRVILNQEHLGSELLQDELLQAGAGQVFIAPLNGGTTIPR